MKHLYQQIQSYKILNPKENSKPIFLNMIRTIPWQKEFS